MEVGPNQAIIEPNIGDFGCLEDPEEQEKDDELPPELFEQMMLDQSKLTVKDQELLKLIQSNTVTLSPSEMRKEEEKYVQIVNKEEDATPQATPDAESEAVSTPPRISTMVGDKDDV